MSNTITSPYKQRIAAVIIIAAGYGWAGGHFIPAGSPFFAYIFQSVVLLLLIIFSVAFATTQSEQLQTKKRWPVKALSILAGITLAANIANIIQGAVSHGTNAYGSHNTVEDLVPICIIIAGDVLWLITLLPFYNRSGH